MLALVIFYLAGLTNKIAFSVVSYNSDGTTLKTFIVDGQ